MSRRFVALGLLVTLFQTFTLPARSEVLWTATCTLTVTFRFNSPVRTTGTAPTYDITVAPALDLDPTWDGTQPCVSTFSGTEPGRTTSVTASSTNTTLWTCGAVVSRGNWSQSWRDRHGVLDPPPQTGSHFITGTWGAWTMELENLGLSLVGAIALTVHPDDAGKLASCQGGFTSLKMVGQQIVQDP